MNFSQQIKDIRQKTGMTQEQFALKLNVTRQAISNWENNKNLPDIEMLITISNIFDIPLDHLIKGDATNMTQKLIKDGSETRKARYNMISAIVGSLLILIGIIFLLIKGLSVEYIDEQGILHENFFLIPIGFLCIFSGLITLSIAGIKSLFNKRNKGQS